MLLQGGLVSVPWPHPLSLFPLSPSPSLYSVPSASLVFTLQVHLHFISLHHLGLGFWLSERGVLSSNHSTHCVYLYFLINCLFVYSPGIESRALHKQSKH